jgi:ATP-binding cassette subfamily F protein 3
MGREQPQEGTVALGQHNVLPQYFEQNQAEALDLNTTAFDTLQAIVPDWKAEQVRALLGQFLFSGEMAFKTVGALSGGEKARLALACMLVRPANLLILDEPTNHLDIPAKETLEAALRQYDGTVLLVSHDRFFISQVANKIVEVRDGELRLYRGDYHYYLEKLEEEKTATQRAAQEAERAAKAAARRQKDKEKQKAKAEARKAARAGSR